MGHPTLNDRTNPRTVPTSLWLFGVAFEFYGREDIETGVLGECVMPPQGSWEIMCGAHEFNKLLRPFLPGAYTAISVQTMVKKKAKPVILDNITVIPQ